MGNFQLTECTRLYELAGSFKGPWKAIWKSMAPSRVKCFSWLVVKKACLTLEAVKRRKIQIASRFPLCMEAEEINSHLFLHCKVTSQARALFICLAREEWTMPEHTADILSCWIRWGGRKSQKKWWRTVPACIWWNIWKERNDRIFEGRSSSIQKIKCNCIPSLCFWCKEKCIEEELQIVVSPCKIIFWRWPTYP